MNKEIAMLLSRLLTIDRDIADKLDNDFPGEDASNHVRAEIRRLEEIIPSLLTDW